MEASTKRKAECAQAQQALFVNAQSLTKQIRAGPIGSHATPRFFEFGNLAFRLAPFSLAPGVSFDSKMERSKASFFLPCGASNLPAIPCLSMIYP